MRWAATHRASPDGLMDMSGNVLEWVNDWYDADYYQRMPVTSLPTARRGRRVVTVARMCLRCSWMSKRQQIRVAYRGNGTVHTELDQIGFRCARSDTAGE